MKPNQTIPILNLALVFENYYSHLSTMPPTAREGLHVSDVVFDRGWRCDRYVQLVLMQAGFSHVDEIRFRIKRLKLGDAFHEMSYKYLEDALRMYAERLDWEIVEIAVEEPLQDPSTGMIGTPDIVVTYRVPGVDNSIKVVYDIKSMNFGEWRRRQTKRHGFSPKKEHRRQLLTYVGMAKADYAAFLIIQNYTPYRHIQHIIDPVSSILDVIKQRILTLEDLQEKGLYAAKTKSKSYCTSCPMQGSCRAADQYKHAAPVR